jgi:hypothetical protein
MNDPPNQGRPANVLPKLDDRKSLKSLDLLDLGEAAAGRICTVLRNFSQSGPVVADADFAVARLEHSGGPLSRGR